MFFILFFNFGSGCPDQIPTSFYSFRDLFHEFPQNINYCKGHRIVLGVQISTLLGRGGNPRIPCFAKEVLNLDCEPPGGRSYFMGLISPRPSKESVPSRRSINICPVNERMKVIQNSPLQEVWISSIWTSVTSDEGTIS